MTRSIRFILTLSALAIAGVTHAQQLADNSQPALIGKIENGYYTSPSGAFRLKVPFTPGTAGTANYNDSVVVFEDGKSFLISVGAIKFDALLNWECETRDRSDFLQYFLQKYVLAEFASQLGKASVETNLFLPKLQGGAVLVSMSSPGGSSFAPNPALKEGEAPVLCKRGYLIFVRNKHVFVLSTEIGERVTSRDTYKMSPVEEDAFLKKRLMEYLDRIQFTDAPAATK